MTETACHFEVFDAAAAVGYVQHPVVGVVPACQECADRLHLPIVQPLDPAVPDDDNDV